MPKCQICGIGYVLQEDVDKCHELCLRERDLIAKLNELDTGIEDEPET